MSGAAFGAVKRVATSTISPCCNAEVLALSAERPEGPEQANGEQLSTIRVYAHECSKCNEVVDPRFCVAVVWGEVSHAESTAEWFRSFELTCLVRDGKVVFERADGGALTTVEAEAIRRSIMKGTAPTGRR